MTACSFVEIYRLLNELGASVFSTDECFSTLQKGAVDFSETSTSFRQPGRHHSQKDDSLRSHICYNLKSRMYNKLFYT
jgi:hypothetical protein